MAPTATVCLLNAAGNDNRAFRASSACQVLGRLGCRNHLASLAYVNLFPRIAMTPADLWALPEAELLDEDADAAIVDAGQHTDFVVVAFGVPTNSRYEALARHVFEILRASVVFAVCQ